MSETNSPHFSPLSYKYNYIKARVIRVFFKKEEINSIPSDSQSKTAPPCGGAARRQNPKLLARHEINLTARLRSGTPAREPGAEHRGGGIDWGNATTHTRIIRPQNWI
jgi:hypothetical protein